jgi:enoyl-CoA hydratase
MAEGHVVVEAGPEHVTVITLNRPEVRNAVNASMAGAIVDAVAASQEGRCIVITGADPAFCAGLDLKNVGTDRLADLPPFIDALAASAVPTIAAVNGPAVTGGLELALACDFIVASERARFADTHLRVGVYPGRAVVDLPRRIGLAKAKELSMTSDFVDAVTAWHWGLANHVVPHDELLPRTLEIAAAIAEQDPAMVQVMRRDWTETYGLPLDEAHRRHRDIALEAGYLGARSDTLRSNRDAVVARAHRQSP